MAIKLSSNRSEAGTSSWGAEEAPVAAGQRRCGDSRRANAGPAEGREGPWWLTKCSDPSWLQRDTTFGWRCCLGQQNEMLAWPDAFCHSAHSGAVRWCLGLCGFGRGKGERARSELHQQQVLGQGVFRLSFPRASYQKHPTPATSPLVELRAPSDRPRCRTGSSPPAMGKTRDKPINTAEGGGK